MIHKYSIMNKLGIKLDITQTYPQNSLIPKLFYAHRSGELIGGGFQINDFDSSSSLTFINVYVRSKQREN